jgi:CDP-2,3-bis-(O-geranylgeranyl)-sn-glycerol synthase
LVPAYVTNGMGLVFGGGRPIDFGRNFIDGRRILGDGKTFRGAAGGIVCGTLASLAEAVVVNLFLGGFFSFSLNLLHVIFGFAVSVGAVLGDLVGAFVKRRLGIPRGAPAPGLDQLGFIVVALILAWVVLRFVALGGEITWVMVATILVMTPFIHLLGNCIAVRFGKKNKPW